MQPQITLINEQPDWLVSLVRQRQQKQLPTHIYTESKMGNFHWHRRLVWEASVTEQMIDILVPLAFEISLCALCRNNDLLGLEIAGIHLTDAEMLEVLSFPVGAELFHLPDILPTLAKPGLLLMDMDSTAIQIECIDELAVMAGVGEQVAQITERAMQGELDFGQSLRQRVATLKGADANIIDKLCQSLPLMPGLEAMVAEFKSRNWHVVLASGGFTPFVNSLKNKLGLDAVYANELVIENGILTGEVTGQIVDAQCKAEILKSCGAQFGIPASQWLAIGDGANDIPMIETAVLGVAYHAKPKLKAMAGACISQLDLRALTFLV